MVTKQELLKTKSLDEAINVVFDKISASKTCILTNEAMTGQVAKEYDDLGKFGRQETYRKLAEDFKRRTNCYGKNHPFTDMNVGTILEVGSGSGLLTIELAEQTNGKIIGLDLSEDMISLAEANLRERSKRKIEEIKDFWKKIPDYHKPSKADYKKLEENPPLFDRIRFVNGNVYDINNLDFQNINYVVCRNALHRFQHPEKAIKQMHDVLSSDGKLYIRDLRRDANWQTILERIGKKRWDTQTLVQDYVGAMASMFTISELEITLNNLNIKNYEIADGRYVSGEIQKSDNLKEFERETEYVCVIKK